MELADHTGAIVTSDTGPVQFSSATWQKQAAIGASEGRLILATDDQGA